MFTTCFAKLGRSQVSSMADQDQLYLCALLQLSLLALPLHSLFTFTRHFTWAQGCFHWKFGHVWFFFNFFLVGFLFKVERFIVSNHKACLLKHLQLLIL